MTRRVDEGTVAFGVIAGTAAAVFGVVIWLARKVVT